jgi:DNA-directed RNA polymerase subunit K/omega
VSAATLVAPESAVPEGGAASEVFGNRFLLVAVASQRVLQIRNGSRPRLDAGTHKPCLVAIAEVVAGSVPYFAL